MLAQKSNVNLFLPLLVCTHSFISRNACGSHVQLSIGYWQSGYLSLPNWGDALLLHALTVAYSGGEGVLCDSNCLLATGRLDTSTDQIGATHCSLMRSPLQTVEVKACCVTVPVAQIRSEIGNEKDSGDPTGIGKPPDAFLRYNDCWNGPLVLLRWDHLVIRWDHLVTPGPMSAVAAP